MGWTVATLATTVLAGGCATTTYHMSDPALSGAIARAAEADPDIQTTITNSRKDRIGCAAQLLARDRVDHAVYYAWIECVGPPNQGEISEPVRVTTNQANVRSIQEPSETDYSGSLKRLFPGWIRDQLVHLRGVDSTALTQEARRAQAQR